MTWEERINAAGLRYAASRVDRALSYFYSLPPKEREQGKHVMQALTEAHAVLVGLDEKQMRVLRLLLEEG